MAYKKLLGALVAVVGSLALTACNTGGNCGCAGPAVYKRPCCAQSQNSCGSCGTPAPSYAPAPVAKPAGQMACGTGKCG